MDIPAKIRAVCGALRISEAELARRIGTTPSAFHQRLSTGKFTTAELNQIADTLGVQFICCFRFPDGTEV